jgi:hypothetical protein
MLPINPHDISQYVETNIPQFHESRIKGLTGLKLRNILKRKNPYLFKAKNLITASNLVEELLKAHLSSSEEGLFGGFLEGFAVFICTQAFGGRKSFAEGTG